MSCPSTGGAAVLQIGSTSPRLAVRLLAARFRLEGTRTGTPKLCGLEGWGSPTNPESRKLGIAQKRKRARTEETERGLGAPGSAASQPALAPSSTHARGSASGANDASCHEADAPDVYDSLWAGIDESIADHQTLAVDREAGFVAVSAPDGSRMLIDSCPTHARALVLTESLMIIPTASTRCAGAGLSGRHAAARPADGDSADVSVLLAPWHKAAARERIRHEQRQQQEQQHRCAAMAANAQDTHVLGAGPHGTEQPRRSLQPRPLRLAPPEGVSPGSGVPWWAPSSHPSPAAHASREGQLGLERGPMLSPRPALRCLSASHSVAGRSCAHSV